MRTSLCAANAAEAIVNFAMENKGQAPSENELAKLIDKHFEAEVALMEHLYMRSLEKRDQWRELWCGSLGFNTEIKRQINAGELIYRAKADALRHWHTIMGLLFGALFGAIVAAVTILSTIK